MAARDRFVQTRSAILEYDELRALLEEGGDDWRPEGIKATGIGDPTANRAIRNVDVLGDRLEAIRARVEELEGFIGLTLRIIEGVRKGLGEDYANLLDQRYIDGLTWRDVTLNGQSVSPSSGKAKVALAFDWIDSLGLTKILGGEYEL